MIFEVFRHDVPVVRKTGGSYVGPLWVEGVGSTFTIKASVQPTSYGKMELLPEGYRDKQSYTLYTDTELFTDIPGGDPDTVIIEALRYLVVKTQRWQNGIISHFEIIVVKEDKDAN